MNSVNTDGCHERRLRFFTVVRIACISRWRSMVRQKSQPPPPFCPRDNTLQSYIGTPIRPPLFLFLPSSKWFHLSFSLQQSTDSLSCQSKPTFMQQIINDTIHLARPIALISSLPSTFSEFRKATTSQIQSLIQSLGLRSEFCMQLQKKKKPLAHHL